LQYGFPYSSKENPMLVVKNKKSFWFVNYLRYLCINEPTSEKADQRNTNQNKDPNNENSL